MPSLTENKMVWDQFYDWSMCGDKWSAASGGVSYQWWTTLFPRLQRFVPARRILEIAPGYGRWTHYLKPSVSAAVLEFDAVQVGLSCVTQETLAWGNDDLLNDCISVITRLGSRQRTRAEPDVQQR